VNGFIVTTQERNTSLSVADEESSVKLGFRDWDRFSAKTRFTKSNPIIV